MVRAMVVNGAELGTYSQAKQFLLETGWLKLYFKGCIEWIILMADNSRLAHSWIAYFQDNITCHFVASTLSGFVTAVVSMPADIAKTRYSRH